MTVLTLVLMLLLAGDCGGSMTTSGVAVFCMIMCFYALAMALHTVGDKVANSIDKLTEEVKKCRKL